MLIEILISLVSLCFIVILFQFCKCKKQNIEGFYEISGIEQKLQRQINKKKLAEKFVTKEEIDKIEQNTIEILSNIQTIKNKMNNKMTIQEEEFDDTELLNKFKKIDEEIDENIIEPNAIDDDDDEYDKLHESEEEEDVVEGFMERTTHNCDII